MWFDAHAALNKIEGCLAATPATSATQLVETAKTVSGVAEVANVAALHLCEMPADTDAFEERAAIFEYDGGLSRADAEHLAAEGQGFENVIDFRSALEGFSTESCPNRQK